MPILNKYFSKFQIFVISIFLLALSLWLCYKLINLTPTLNEKTSEKLITQGWFYSPEGLYFILLDNRIYARDIKTEKTVWECQLTENKKRFSSTLHPVIDKNSVYFNLENQLYSLDIKNGRQRWSFSGSGDDYLLPDADKDLVFFGNKSGLLYALENNTGKVKWQHNFKVKKPVDKIEKNLENIKPKVDIKYEFSHPRPAIAQATYNYFYKFYKLNNNTGQSEKNFRLKKRTPAQMVKASNSVIDWQERVNPSAYINNNNFKTRDLNKALIAFKGVIYYPFGNEPENYLYAIDSKTGKEKWKVIYSPSEFITAGEIIYFNNTGYIYAINQNTGDEVWKFKANGFVSKLLMQNGIIYVQDSLYSMYALKPETGEEIWHFKSEQLIFSPVIIGENLYFTLSDSNLVSKSYLSVIDAKTGNFKWKITLNENEWIYSLNINNNELYMVTSIKEKNFSFAEFVYSFWYKISNLKFKNIFSK